MLYYRYSLFPTNHFSDDDLLCAGADAVHTLEPFHLIGGFQTLGDAFGGGHLANCCFKLFPCNAVDVERVLRQFAEEDEGGKRAVVLFFEVAPAHSSILADAAIGLRVYDQIGDLEAVDSRIRITIGLYASLL